MSSCKESITLHLSLRSMAALSDLNEGHSNISLLYINIYDKPIQVPLIKNQFGKSYIGWSVCKKNLFCFLLQQLSVTDQFLFNFCACKILFSAKKTLVILQKVSFIFKEKFDKIGENYMLCYYARNQKIVDTLKDEQPVPTR